MKMQRDYEIYMNTPSTYNDKIGISIPEGSYVLEFKNSHGDGESYVIIKLSEKGKNKFLEETEKSNKWSNLSLPYLI